MEVRVQDTGLGVVGPDSRSITSSVREPVGRTRGTGYPCAWSGPSRAVSPAV
ncbi:hypothetical protein [Streptomyces sp. NPDC054794]